MLYESIFKVLNTSGIKYVVIGGIAVNLHGFARATGDLDIVISLTDEDISHFIRAVKKIGLVPRLPISINELANAEKRQDWIHNKQMKAFSLAHPKKPLEQIDVMIDHAIDFSELYKNRIMMEAGKTMIPVASIPDLILLKKHAHRERDMIDIRALERIERFKRDEAK